MKYEQGFKFMDTIRDYEIITFIPKHNMYLLRNFTDNRQDELMNEPEIDGYILRNEEIKIKREKTRIKQLEYEKIEKLEEEKRLAAEYNYNFCYGYTDNKTDLQKGKILKILNTRELYNNEYISRKNLIERIIKNNNDVTISVFNNTNRYSDKRVCLTYKKLADKIEYRIKFNECHMLEVTKTEYDYASYLIDNNLIKEVA